MPVQAVTVVTSAANSTMSQTTIGSEKTKPISIIDVVIAIKSFTTLVFLVILLDSTMQDSWTEIEEQQYLLLELAIVFLVISIFVCVYIKLGVRLWAGPLTNSQVASSTSSNLPQNTNGNNLNTSETVLDLNYYLNALPPPCYKTVMDHELPPPSYDSIIVIQQCDDNIDDQNKNSTFYYKNEVSNYI